MNIVLALSILLSYCNTTTYDAPCKVTDEMYLNAILDKHAVAMGGKENWKSLKSFRMHYLKSNGSSSIMTALMPDHLRISFKRGGNTLEKVFDGTHGYIIRDGNYEPMRPGESVEMKEEPEYFSELIFAREYGYNINWLDDEVVEGKDCYKLSVQKNDVDTQMYWIDKSTYLIHMTGEYSEDSAHAGIYYKTLLSDYRDVNGLMFPFVQTLLPSNRDAIESTVSLVQTDIEGLSHDAFVYNAEDSKNLIAYWKDRYATSALESMNFKQETVAYKDAQADTSIWYEAIQYPDKFRIDFGDKSSKNCNLYRSDSLYVFRDGSLKFKGPKIQDFLIMEGALYSYSVDSTISLLEKTGVDTELFYTTSYKAYDCYVIGGQPGDSSTSQIWLDKKNRLVVRRVSILPDGRKMEVRYDDFKQIDNHYVESWLEFYIDGILIQTERYYDIEVNQSFNASIFDPSGCLSTYWY